MLTTWQQRMYHMAAKPILGAPTLFQCLAQPKGIAIVPLGDTTHSTVRKKNEEKLQHFDSNNGKW